MKLSGSSARSFDPSSDISPHLTSMAFWHAEAYSSFMKLLHDSLDDSLSEAVMIKIIGIEITHCDQKVASVLSLSSSVRGDHSRSCIFISPFREARTSAVEK